MRWRILILSCAMSATSLAASPAGLAAAEQLFAQRRYAEAEAAFATLQSEFPDHPAILRALGQLAMKRQDQAAAVQFLERAVTLEPDDAQLHFEYAAACGFYAGTLGTSFKALGLARRASRSLQRAIELEPDELKYRIGFIEFSLEAPAIAGGGRTRAREQADAIAAHNATKGAFAWALIHRAEGDPAAALQVFDDLLAQSPDNYFALFNFGKLAAESGLRLDTGRTRLEQCLALPVPADAPSPAHVWSTIATLEQRRGDRAAARTALEQAAALAPDDARIAAQLARFAAEDS